MNLTIPYPPTGNHTVKHSRFGGHYISTEAQAYRSLVKSLVARIGAASGLCGAIRVVAEICPPDKRKRDLDNAWKTAADALTHAGVWNDDYQIEDLRLIRGNLTPGGSVSIYVEEIP